MQASPATIGANLVFGVLYFRWLAGIADNFGAEFLSQTIAGTATLLLAGLTLAKARIPKRLVGYSTGLTLWILVAACSFYLNPESDSRAGLALIALLGFYLFFGITAFDAVTYATSDRLKTFLQAFIVIGAVLSIYQFATGTGFIETGNHPRPRAFGSDVHPVSFGIQIVIAMVGLEVIRLRSLHPVTVMHIAFLLIGSLALYLTLARTAWAMALVILVLANFATASSPRRLLFTGVILLTGIVFVTKSQRFTDLSSLPFFLENFRFGDTVFDFRFVDNSISWRLVNWSYGLQQALEQPLFGHGPGQSATASYFQLEMHNIFLEALFEGGVFNLLALIVLVASLVRIHGFAGVTSAAGKQARRLTSAMGVSLLLAAIFSTSLVDQLMSVVLYLSVLAFATSEAPPIDQGGH